MHHQRALRKQELAPYIYLNLDANRTQCDASCAAAARGINNYAALQKIGGGRNSAPEIHFLKETPSQTWCVLKLSMCRASPRQIYIHQSVTSVLIFLLSAVFKVLSCCTDSDDGLSERFPHITLTGTSTGHECNIFFFLYIYMLMLFSTRSSFIAINNIWLVTLKAHPALNFIYFCIYTYIYFPPTESVCKATRRIIYNMLVHIATPAHV